MKKKIAFIIALAWILGGCSSAPVASSTSQLTECKTQFPWFCRGNPQAPAVTLNTTVGKLKSSPYCVRADKGTQIRFELKPKGNKPLNSVQIVPKDPKDNHWLAKSNSSDQDLILVDVPNDIDETKKHYYGIKTDTDCVDPRIHVTD